MAPSRGRCLCDRPDNRENAPGYCIQWTPALRNGLATLLLVAYQQHVGGGVAAFCDKNDPKPHFDQKQHWWWPKSLPLSLVVTSANGRTLTPDALIETDRRIVIYKECVLEHTKVHIRSSQGRLGPKSEIQLLEIMLVNHIRGGTSGTTLMQWTGHSHSIILATCSILTCDMICNECRL